MVLLATLAYLPMLGLPFISDDFTQIPAAGRNLSSLHSLFSSPGLRTRLTYVLLDGGLLRGFGFTPLPFYISSISLHVLCTLLVYASGSISSIGWRRSLWAACFFAVFEGHQEAVMWIAASMELLLFLFGVGAILLWDLWLRGGGGIKGEDGMRCRYYPTS